jgi:hypothetical protein
VKSKVSARAPSRADRARAAVEAAEAARVRMNPFVIEGRTSGAEWSVISEREFTGNAEDPETQMASRPLDRCRAHIGGAVGRRRIAPAQTWAVDLLRGVANALEAAPRPQRADALRLLLPTLRELDRGAALVLPCGDASVTA